MTLLATSTHAGLLLVWGIVIHLVCDWLLQNHWIAVNKSNPKHIAGYIHAVIHFLGMLLIFQPAIAGLIALTHWLIDLRSPMEFWRNLLKQTRLETYTPDEPPFPTASDYALVIDVAIWGDQIAHILCLAFFAWFAR